MLPCRKVHQRLPELMITDTDHMNDPTAPLLSQLPIGEDFVPDVNLVLSDLTIATNGADEHHTTMGTVDNWDNGVDPATRDQSLFIYQEVLWWGFNWSGSGTPPTVYGKALVGEGRTKLYGVERFSEPVRLETLFDLFQIPSRIFSFPVSIWR